MTGWDYFSRFRPINAKYLPSIGEGENMATQIVTAANKLVYKWYNDGDVYDNTYVIDGWCNDLSSYANWLYRYAGVADILSEIGYINTESEYEDLLAHLCDTLLNDELLTVFAKRPRVSSIYDCDGPFEFRDCPYDDEEDYY